MKKISFLLLVFYCSLGIQREAHAQDLTLSGGGGGFGLGGDSTYTGPYTGTPITLSGGLGLGGDTGTLLTVGGGTNEVATAPPVTTPPITVAPPILLPLPVVPLTVSGGGASTTAVPEPSTWAMGLVLLSLAGIYFGIRRGVDANSIT